LFLPLFYYGIYLLFSKKYYSLLILLLVSPIPSAITRDAPHTLRSILFLAASTIVFAVGFENFFKKLNFQAISYFLLGGLLILSLIDFKRQYSQYAQKYSQSWQYGYQQLVDILKTNYQQYDHIYITKVYGEPHEFILFYWPWPPQNYQTNPKIWDYHSDWYWVDGFDKFTFINDWQVKDQTIPSKSLLVTSPGNYNLDNATFIKTINFLDQTPAFDLVSYE
jgi:hypothetical protein